MLYSCTASNTAVSSCVATHVRTTEPLYVPLYLYTSMLKYNYMYILIPVFMLIRMYVYMYQHKYAYAGNVAATCNSLIGKLLG